MILVLATVLLIATIDCALGNKFSDAISEYIGRICSKLFNKKPTDVNQTPNVDNEKKETVGFFMKPKCIDKKEFLPMQGGLPVTTPSFNVPIPFNTVVNILEMVGLDKYRWIVNNVFRLNVRGQKIDTSNFCTINATRTIVFFIGEKNKFSLSISFDSGEAIIKTNSKEFESEVAVLTFGAKSIYESPKAYYGKATLELARMAQKKLEESENDKIGDDNV